MKVFVVLGERGEYSDRDVWVSGVFTTEEDARQAIERRSVVHRVHKNWQDRYYRKLEELCKADKISPLQDSIPYFFAGASAEVVRKANERWQENQRLTAEQVGPEPEAECAERFSLVPVGIGEWFNGIDDD